MGFHFSQLAAFEYKECINTPSACNGEFNSDYLSVIEEKKEAIAIHSPINKIINYTYRHWFSIVGVLIASFSFYVRWRGVYWQLPDRFWGDEQAMIEMARSVSIGDGWLRIEGKLGFWYGPAHIYIMSVVFYLFEKIVEITAWFPSGSQVPTWVYFFLARCLTVAYSTATTAIIVFLFKGPLGKTTALIGGLLFALHPLALETALIAKPDALATLFCTLTIYLSIKLMTARVRVYYLLAGLAYGMALASKLFAIGLFLPLLAGHILAQEGDKPLIKLINAIKDIRWLILPAAALLGYLIANPQILQVPEAFLSSITDTVFGRHVSYSETQRFHTLQEQLYRLWEVSSYQVGRSLLPENYFRYMWVIIPIIGIIVMLSQRLKPAIVLLAALIGAHVFNFPAIAKYGGSHYLFVINPIYGLIIGAAVDALRRFSTISIFSRHKFLVYITATATAAILILPMWNTMNNYLGKLGVVALSRETDFRKWMIDHIPVGSRIVYDRYGTELLPGYFDVDARSDREATLDYYMQRYDYVILSNDRRHDYKVHQSLLSPRSQYERASSKLVAVFERDELRFLPALRVYKMNWEGNFPKPTRIKNFYTESLNKAIIREGLINNASFENTLVGNWGAKFINVFQDGKSIVWWDGKSNPETVLIEQSSAIYSNGKTSLHIALVAEPQSLASESEWYNIITENNSYFKTSEARWKGQGDHRISLSDQKTAYEGAHALKVISTGKDKDNLGSAVLRHQAFLPTYINGQDNILSFYAKSSNGARILRVRSGDNTMATVHLTNAYKKYGITGFKKERTHIKFSLSGAGTFYLDSVEFLVRNSRGVSVGQVIPYDSLKKVQDFSIDYYIPCSMEPIKSKGLIKVHFIAESIGNQYLGQKTYTLYDTADAQSSKCDTWQTFTVSIRAAMTNPFIRWKDIEFMTLLIDIMNQKGQHFDAYIDNIQTKSIAKP